MELKGSLPPQLWNFLGNISEIIFYAYLIWIYFYNTYWNYGFVYPDIILITKCEKHLFSEKQPS